MSCAKGKDTFPDLQTSLVVRDQLILRYGVAFLAYKCMGGCEKWHLTTRPPTDRRIRRWNNINTDVQRKLYDALVEKAREAVNESTGL